MSRSEVNRIASRRRGESKHDPILGCLGLTVSCPLVLHDLQTIWSDLATWLLVEVLGAKRDAILDGCPVNL
jgi:hypothetical protein